MGPVGCVGCHLRMKGSMMEVLGMRDRVTPCNMIAGDGEGDWRK